MSEIKVYNIWMGQYLQPVHTGVLTRDSIRPNLVSLMSSLSKHDYLLRCRHKQPSQQQRLIDFLGFSSPEQYYPSAFILLYVCCHGV